MSHSFRFLLMTFSTSKKEGGRSALVPPFRVNTANKSCDGLTGQATEENGGGHKCNHGGSSTGI